MKNSVKFAAAALLALPATSWAHPHHDSLLSSLHHAPSAGVVLCGVLLLAAVAGIALRRRAR